MTDWDQQLRRRRAAVDRAQEALERDVAAASAAGHSLRWIGARVRMNHEVVRKVVARLRSAPPPEEPGAGG